MFEVQRYLKLVWMRDFGVIQFKQSNLNLSTRKLNASNIQGIGRLPNLVCDLQWKYQQASKLSSNGCHTQILLTTLHHRQIKLLIQHAQQTSKYSDFTLQTFWLIYQMAVNSTDPRLCIHRLAIHGVCRGNAGFGQFCKSHSFPILYIIYKNTDHTKTVGMHRVLDAHHLITWWQTIAPF